MKKLLIIVLFICFSCQEKQQEKQVDNPCIKIEKKYDSILALSEDYKNTSIYKFHNILNKEKGHVSDSILINEYKKIEGTDSLLNFYIWDRINTIKFNSYKINVLEKYSGKYLLRRTFNPKYAEATSIRLLNDSCFIYKGKNLVVSDKINLANSSSESINGRFRIKNYNVGLAQFSQHKFITLKDNSCADCEQLQFDKVN